tara:strand:+ start:150 stop:1226 length:1077 start_codon:yes stop_codon:yes gene_type:complete
MINYAWCATGTCAPACSSGAPLFSVGDYVDVDQHVVGLPYDGSSWLEWELYDLAQSGASNGSGFQWTNSPVSGCNASGNSWKVTRREYGDKDSWGTTYDCKWGYQIEFTGCAPCSGSTPVTCSATGMAPNFSSPYALFIPELYLSSGAICTGDASCVETCSMSGSLFEVGDYVNFTSSAVSGYENYYGGFSGAFVVDLAASGNGTGHTSTEPFFTGCGGSVGSSCNWMFAYTGGIDPPPETGIGEWQLSSSGSCCDCYASRPSDGLQANGTYIYEDFGTVSVDCSASGCNALTQSWKIIGKTSGDSTSTPDSLDCTWGYAVSFTGCPSSSSTCSVTGSAPVRTVDWIPEIYFTSGSSC